MVPAPGADGQPISEEGGEPGEVVRPARDGDRRHPLRWPLLATLAVVVVVLLPVLGAGMIWDDEATILLNPAFRGLGPEQLRWMFTTFHMGHYQPLAWLTFGADYLVWGLDPRGYHLTNLLVHLASTLLVFLLTRDLIRILSRTTSDRNGTPDRSHEVGGACLAALLFGVHPLQVESVAWITERRGLLSALFMLACTRVYLRGSSTGRLDRRRYGAALGLYALALLAQIGGVMTPFVLLLLDWHPLRRLDGSTPGETRRALLDKIPFLALSVGAIVIGVRAQAFERGLVGLGEHGLLERVFHACYGLGFYLGKVMAPWPLAPFYGLNRTMGADEAVVVVTIALVLAGGGIIVSIARRHRSVAAAAAMFVLYLVPVLGVFRNGLHDRYAYLPIAALAVWLGAGVSLWMRGRKLGPLRTRALLVCGSWVAILGVITFEQAKIWRTPLEFWRHAVERAPSPVTHYNYAGVLSVAGERGLAIAHLERAVDLDPRFQDGHRTLGRLLARAGEPVDGLRHVRQAIALDSLDARSHQVAAEILARSGRPLEAEREFVSALSCAPATAELLYAYGTFLVSRGRPEEAVEAFRRSIALDPMEASVRWNLAGALGQLGRREEARAELERVLIVDPGHEGARRLLHRLGSLP
jgi:Flp pilus assembly protein TadD